MARITCPERKQSEAIVRTIFGRLSERGKKSASTLMRHALEDEEPPLFADSDTYRSVEEWVSLQMILSLSTVMKTRDPEHLATLAVIFPSK